MRQFPKPSIEVTDCGLTLTEHGEVTGMNQEITIWNIKLPV
jgi:hypothetical protein